MFLILILELTHYASLQMLGQISLMIKMKWPLIFTNVAEITNEEFIYKALA